MPTDEREADRDLPLSQILSENFHVCKRADSWIESDARGIELCRVCDICVKEKLAKYRPEVLTDPGYETFGEQIEEDE